MVNPLFPLMNLKDVMKTDVSLTNFSGNFQDGRGVRWGDNPLPHSYIKNTSAYGTTPAEHILNARGRS